ncbi:hypothetical protein SeMB42_g06741 [Synchytrium endobioticum]|uniref:tRNA pseudouridine(55) synthase n=1 Tax=Synchytrium endobioticum TaxID=286115 RepID=A0A507CKJ8_9FUNG|nr:hypothetical protein SeMB42_g06741 [Synchytrium endobioticum]
MTMAAYSTRLARFVALIQKVKSTDFIPSQRATFLINQIDYLCPKCVLRFMGFRDRSIYDQFNPSTWPTDDAPHSIPPQESPATSTLPPVPPQLTSTKDQKKCLACVGILELDYDQLANDAKDQILQDGYNGLLNFVLAVKVPLQLQIRQRAIQSMLASHLNGPPQPPVEIKDVIKLILPSKIQAATGLEPTPSSPMTMNYEFDHIHTQSDMLFLKNKGYLNFKVSRRKGGQLVIQGLSNEKLVNAVNALTHQNLLDANQIPPLPVTTPPSIVFFPAYGSIYLAGRYNKYQRGISHTPYEFKGKRLAEQSVSEFLEGAALQRFNAQQTKFASAGREDVDVRMLGKGRPFYMELISPRTVVLPDDKMKQFQAQVNQAAKGKVRFTHLQLVSRDSTNILKDSASTKCKTYRTLVELPALPTPLQIANRNATYDLPIKQQNPTRVPRRADLTRDKIIHHMTITVVPPSPPSTDSPIAQPEPNTNTEVGTAQTYKISMELKTSAGTYIKEFVHGDNGRTKPSLHELLEMEWAKCLELDVVDVDLDWPQDVDGDQGSEFEVVV